MRARLQPCCKWLEIRRALVPEGFPIGLIGASLSDKHYCEITMAEVLVMFSVWAGRNGMFR